MTYSTEELRNRYSNLSDEMLVDLVQSGGLTDSANAIAQEELLKRNIALADFEAVKKKGDERKRTVYKEIGVPQPPKVWISFLLAFLLLIGEVIQINIDDTHESGFGIFVTPLMVACLLYYIHMVRRLHDILNVLTVEKYPISTSKALGFHLIPVFNLYWLVKWPSELSKFITNNSNVKVVPGFVVGICLILSILVIRTVDSAIGFMLLYATMAYVITKVNKLIANNEIDC